MMRDIKKITFILPTKSRIDKIKKFYEINEVKLKKIPHCFIIVTSNVRETNILKNFFKQKKTVKVIKQNKPGFMNACFESITYIKTKYCTFLYDDDLLSPYYFKLFKKLYTESIAMGYGVLSNNNSNNIFLPIRIKKLYSEKILSCYYGENLTDVKFMPVSPICLIFPSIFLSKWKKKILNFCKNNSLRTEMLLKKNIGPDLMLYLHQIIKHKNINFSYPHIVEFRMHKKSMSYILGKNKLRVGYWLAKSTLLNSNRISNDLKKKIFTYLIVSGYLILFHNLILSIIKKENYYLAFKKEIANIKKSRKFDFKFIYAFKIIINRVYKIL